MELFGSKIYSGKHSSVYSVRETKEFASSYQSFWCPNWYREPHPAGADSPLHAFEHFAYWLPSVTEGSDWVESLMWSDDDWIARENTDFLKTKAYNIPIL